MNPDPTQNTAPEAANVPTTAGMTTKVVKGSLWTLAGQVAPLGVSLFATPFVIRLLGSEGYGVLILVGLVPTYFGFADFGMSIASTKFGSEAYAAGDAEKEGRVVRTSALIALAASLPIALAIFLFSSKIAGLFNVPEHYHAEAALALKIAAVTFVVGFMNNIFNSPQLARLRMDLNTFITSGFRIIGLIATPIVIYLGYGIVGAISVLLAASVMTLAGHIYISGRLVPELFQTTLDRSILRPLLKFGGAIVFLGVAGVVLFNAEKGLLARLVSVEALAFYSVGYTLAAMMIMLSNTLIQSLVPAFSQLTGENNRGVLENLFARIVKLSVILLIPAAAGLCFIVKDFFRVWAGEDFARNSTEPFFILILGLIVSVPGYVPYSLLMAVGKADTIARLYWIEIIPYLSLIYVLTLLYGINGTAAAWSIRVAFDGIVFFVMTGRGLSLKVFSVSTRSLWVALGVAIYIPTIYLSVSVTDHLSLFSFLIFSLTNVAYLFILWKKVLVAEEKAWLLGSLSLRRILGNA